MTRHMRALAGLTVALCVANGAIAQNLQRIGPRQVGGANAVHQPFEPPVTAAKIRTAIDDAVTFLRSCQNADGSISQRGGGGYREGGTALATLAILAAGGDPASDDALRKSLDWLAKNGGVDNTYVRGIRANVWEYALRKAGYDKNLRNTLKDDYDWLLKALGNKPGWRYNMSSTDWDNSCTQYGVLGIWAAARAGFDPGEAFWRRMSKHFLECQQPNAGWGYTGPSSTANMTTAGLASMFLVFDELYCKSAYSAKTGNPFDKGEPAECLKSIQTAMTWLGKPQGGKAGGY